MRYSDERSSQNGSPNWPQLYEIVTGSEERITREIRIAVGYLSNQQQRDRDHQHLDIIRVHERVDETHESIGDLRERMTSIETRIETDSTAESSPTGALARMKAWAELIAPLRELLWMALLAASGLAMLLQAPQVRAGLDGLAARFEHQATE